MFKLTKVDNCEANALIGRLVSVIDNNQLTLVRPFQNCGVVFIADKPLNTHRLKALPELDYVEPDGHNQHFRN